jgi:hypothetical protein
MDFMTSLGRWIYDVIKRQTQDVVDVVIQFALGYLSAMKWLGDRSTSGGMLVVRLSSFTVPSVNVG